MNKILDHSLYYIFLYYIPPQCTLIRKSKKNSCFHETEVHSTAIALNAGWKFSIKMNKIFKKKTTYRLQ